MKLLILIKHRFQAFEAAQVAEQIDKTSPQVYFLLFKIYLLKKNEKEAINSIEKLTQLGLESKSSETVHGLVCLSAHLAFEVI